MSKDYNSKLYKRICNIDKKHFWFSGRNFLIKKLINSFNKEKKCVFFEIGFGTGIILEMLEKSGYETKGVDINNAARVYAKKRVKGELLVKSIFDFESKEKFEMIGAFDVVEHIQDDMQFFKKLGSLLNNKGILFLTVPAMPSLWTKIDDHSGHKRRYTLHELESKVKQAGFQIKFINHWNIFSLPFYCVWRKFNNSDDSLLERYLTPPPFLINKFLQLVLVLESLLIFKIHFPVGTSLVLCATKNRNVR